MLFRSMAGVRDVDPDAVDAVIRPGTRLAIDALPSSRWLQWVGNASRDSPGRIAAFTIESRLQAGAPDASQSGEDFVNHAAFDVGEPAFEAVVIIRQTLMVEAEQVQDGGVEVVDIDDVFSGLVAEFIGGTVTEALPDEIGRAHV